MNADYAEQRLVCIGIPLDAALTLCHTMRRDGGLEAFIEQREREYRETVLIKNVCPI